ncbi:hypothetical protein [Methyloglobulus sp.]|uniref:hypothetical protein n=1 Tax=Methyloglobulus sp. TaxID=2518622 RepID=UPI0032B85C88
MNNNPTNISPNGNGDVAVIGEGTPNRKEVSLQVLQDIYHELTGKNEEVSKSYDSSFQIEHSDFEQLNHRITQTCEQYQISSTNCSVKIYYINDTQETFSSFEKFSQFNSGSTSCVESVLLTYNFLILLPRINQPQSYTLTVRVASRITIENKMKEDVVFLPKIFRMMRGRVGVVTVKYIDYAVARNILNVVDEWFNTLRSVKISPTLDFIRKRSSYLPLIARYTAVGVITFLIFLNLSKLLPENASIPDLGRFWLFSSFALFASYKLAHHLGSAAEDSLDNWSPLSYVSLTSGDKKVIEEAKNDNVKTIILALIKFISSLSVSVIAKLIISSIGS